MRIGIDLGTTYSVVARYDTDKARAEVVRNRFQKDLTPSVICFMEDGSRIVGEEAKEMQKGGAAGIASVFKVKMGLNEICAESGGETYTAEDLSRFLLEELIKEAEESAGEKVESAVITVPAYFDDLQRTATKSAAEAAGLQVAKIINEPTAAAIYYGYKHANGKTVLVYDLGGGTFDVTIVHVEGNSIVVKGTYGNHDLGGKDWDELFLGIICDRFRDEYDCDPRDDVHKHNELLADAEDYKKVLSRSELVNTTIEYAGHVGRYTVTRDEFESVSSYLIASTKDVVDEVFRTTGLGPSDIDEVLLCGGSTRLPQIQRFLRDYGLTNIITHRDTDLAVAKGAAMVASLYSSDEKRLRDIDFHDVAPHSLGALSIDPVSGRYINEIIIPMNTPIPVTMSKTFRIEEGNMTDQVEIFMLQGESDVPIDCTIIKREVITGFENTGKGVVIDISYRYTEEGVVNISATRNGRDLSVISSSIPEDTMWMSQPPKARKSNRMVKKNIAICVDLSRSMKASLDTVKQDIAGFVGSLSGEFTNFTLIGFGDHAKVLCEPTTDEEEFLDVVNSMKVNKLGRGTDANPFPLVLDRMRDAKGAKTAIILTDGIWGKRDEAVDDAAECRKEMIQVVALGFGEADFSFIKQIATLEESAMYTTLNNLGNTINTIATAIKNSPTGMVEHFR